MAVTGVWCSGQKRAARTWLVALCGATAVTLVSKSLFLGWGVGIAALDFTGVSGHTLLAASVYPTLFNWLLSPVATRWPYRGAALGLALAAVVAVSRVVLGAHSASEVIIAWLMGLVVSGLVLQARVGSVRPPWYVRGAPLILLMALHSSTATYLPSHNWEVRLALYLSGHDKPFERHQLL